MSEPTEEARWQAQAELNAKSMCLHCDERLGGAEGTMWCAECLEWYRANHIASWLIHDPETITTGGAEV